MSAATDFALNAYASLAGPPENLLARSLYAKGVLGQRANILLTDIYLDTAVYGQEKDTAVKGNPPPGTNLTIIGKEKSALAVLLKHSHHYGTSNVEVSTGSARVTMKWLEPSLDTGYVLRTETEVKYKRGDAENRSFVELQFEKELAVGDLSVKLREFYDPEKQDPRIGVFTGQTAEFPATRIEIVVDGSVLFELDFSTRDVQDIFSSGSQRLGLAILMATKVFGYLSILRVLDAAFFSLLASHAVGSTRINTVSFVDTMTHVQALIEGVQTTEVMHLPLLQPAQITQNVAAKASGIVSARIGAFLDQIKRDAALKLDVADVLLRAKTGERQPSSSIELAEQALASWRSGIATILGSAEPASATARAIADRLRELADQFEQQFNANLQGAAAIYDQIYRALSSAVQTYPTGVEPTADVETIYAAARDAQDKTARRYAKITAGRLAAALRNCLAAQPDLLPIIQSLEKQDPASENRVASLIYLISMSRDDPVNVAGGDGFAAVIANAKPCIDTDAFLVQFLDQFAKTINEEALWRPTIFGTGVQGLRADVLKTTSSILPPLTAEILQNTSLAKAIWQRMNDYLTGYAVKQIQAVQPNLNNQREVNTKNNIQAELAQIVQSLSNTRSAVKLLRNRMSALVANIELGNGVVEMSGDSARAIYLGVLVPLRAAITLAELFEVLYDKGEVEARKLFDKIPTLRPDDDISLEQTLQQIEGIRVSAVATVAAADIDKAEKETVLASGQNNLAGLAGASNLFALAKNGFAAVDATLSSAQFADRSLRLLNELRRLLQVEANRRLPAPGAAISFKDGVKVMHLATAVAYLLDAYKNIEQLHAPSSSQPSHATLLQDFRLLLAKLARNTAAAIAASLQNKAVATPDSALFARELAEYSFYLSTLVASSDRQFYSVPMPADRFLSELLFGGANDASDLISYKNLQRVLFDTILFEQMEKSPSLSIFNEYTLTETQKGEIIADLGTSLQGVVDSVTNLLNAQPPGTANQIGAKAEAIVALLAKNIELSDINDASLRARATNDQANVKKPVTFALTSIDDSGRFAVLRQLVKISREFFAFIDSLIEVPFSPDLKNTFDIIARLERVSLLLLKRIFAFEGDGPPPSTPRVLRVNQDDAVRQSVRRGRDLLRQVRSMEMEPSLGALNQDAARAVFKTAFDKVKALENADTALRELKAVKDYDDALQESHDLADLTRLYESGAEFVYQFAQILDKVEFLLKQNGDARSRGFISLEEARTAAKLLYNKARRIASEHAWSNEIKAFDNWAAMVNEIDTEMASLAVSLTEAQRKLLEVDAAALRAEMLKQFADQAAKIDKSLKESLDSIEKTVKSAKDKSKEADDLHDKLASLQKTISNLNSDDMDVDQQPKGAVAKLERDVQATQKLIDEQTGRIGDIEAESKRLSKQVEEGRKIVRDAKQTLGATDINKLSAELAAEVAKAKTAEDSIAKLRRRVEESDDFIDRASKALKKAEDKARELEIYVANIGKNKAERDEELRRIGSQIETAKGVVAQIDKDRITLDNDVVGLRNRTATSSASVKISLKNIEAEKSELSKASTMLKARQGEQDRLEEKQKDLSSDVDKLKKKVEATEAVIAKIGTTEQAELARMHAQAAKNLNETRESVAKVASLAAEAVVSYDAGVADAKRIEKLDTELSRVADGAKKSELKIRDLATKISYDVTGKPLTQLTSVEATFNRAAKVLEDASFVIAQWIANSRAAGGAGGGQQPPPGGGGQQPPNGGGGGGGGGDGGGGGGGGGGQPPPVKPEPVDIPQELQPLANALTVNLNENFAALALVVQQVNAVTKAPEFAAASRALDELASKKKPVTDEQMAALFAMFAELEQLIVRMAEKGNEVQVKREKVVEEYEAVVVSQEALKEDLGRRIEAIDAAKKDLNLLYADDGRSGAIVELSNQVDAIQGAAVQKVQAIEDSNAVIGQRAALVQAAIENANGVIQAATDLTNRAAGQEEAIRQGISDYQRRLNDYRLLITPAAIDEIVAPDFNRLLEAAQANADNVVAARRAEFVRQLTQASQVGLPELLQGINIPLLVAEQRNALIESARAAVAQESSRVLELVSAQVRENVQAISGLEGQQTLRIQAAARESVLQIEAAANASANQVEQSAQQRVLQIANIEAAKVEEINVKANEAIALLDRQKDAVALAIEQTKDAKAEQLRLTADSYARQLAIEGAAVIDEAQARSAAMQQQPASVRQAQQYAEKEVETIRLSGFEDVFNALESIGTVVDLPFVQNLRHLWFSLTELVKYISTFRDPDPVQNPLNGEVVPFSPGVVTTASNLLKDAPQNTDGKDFLIEFIAKTVPNRIAFLSVVSAAFVDKFALQDNSARAISRNAILALIKTKGAELFGQFQSIQAGSEAVMGADEAAGLFLMQFYRNAREFVDALVFAFSVTFGEYETAGELVFADDDYTTIRDVLTYRLAIGARIAELEDAVVKSRIRDKGVFIQTKVAPFATPIYVHQRGTSIDEALDAESRAFFAALFVQIDYVVSLLSTPGLLAKVDLEGALSYASVFRTGLTEEQLEFSQTRKTISDKLLSFLSLAKDFADFLEKKVAEANKKRERQEPSTNNDDDGEPGDMREDDDPSSAPGQVAKRRLPSGPPPKSTNKTDLRLGLVKKSKSMLIAEEEFDEDELRDVFTRALALYREERKLKASEEKTGGSVIDL